MLTKLNRFSEQKVLLIIVPFLIAGIFIHLSIFNSETAEEPDAGLKMVGAPSVNNTIHFSVHRNGSRLTPIMLNVGGENIAENATGTVGHRFTSEGVKSIQATFDNQTISRSINITSDPKNRELRIISPAKVNQDENLSVRVKNMWNEYVDGAKIYVEGREVAESSRNSSIEVSIPEDVENSIEIRVEQNNVTSRKTVGIESDFNLVVNRNEVAENQDIVISSNRNAAIYLDQEYIGNTTEGFLNHSLDKEVGNYSIVGEYGSQRERREISVMRDLSSIELSLDMDNGALQLGVEDGEGRLVSGAEVFVYRERPEIENLETRDWEDNEITQFKTSEVNLTKKIDVNRTEVYVNAYYLNKTKKQVVKVNEVE